MGEHGEGFFDGGGDLLGRARQLQAIQQFLIREHGPVIEREVSIVAMAQGDVGEFSRQGRGEGGLVR